MSKTTGSRGKRYWTGRHILMLRIALEETQQEFANRIGVSIATVSRWEGNKGRPGTMARKLLDSIADSLPTILEDGRLAE